MKTACFPPEYVIDAEGMKPHHPLTVFYVCFFLCFSPFLFVCFSHSVSVCHSVAHSLAHSLTHSLTQSDPT